MRLVRTGVYQQETARVDGAYIKNRDHNNNPPDGSNWELLCMYCHEGEHSRSLDRQASGETSVQDDEDRPATYNPFADLKKLVKTKE